MQVDRGWSANGCLLGHGHLCEGTRRSWGQTPAASAARADEFLPANNQQADGKHDGSSD